MLRFTLTGPDKAALDRYDAELRARMQQATLNATDKASSIARTSLRASMQGVGLGRLANAIGSTSDLKKRGRVFLQGAKGFSASGIVHIRGRSERALGALEAYTQGAVITPRRGGWLWFPTDNVPARVGRYRMTPSRYRASGLMSSIGPLVEIPGRRASERLLVVNNVSTRSGKRPNVRKLPKSGRPRAGREVHDVLVMFIGIRSTSRAARFDPRQTIERVMSQLPGLIGDELRNL